MGPAKSDCFNGLSINLSAATGMKWIKAKMEELGMEKHPNYKLCFYMDSLAMITVHTPKYGIINVSFICKGQNDIVRTQFQNLRLIIGFSK